jgi:lysophospholipase L1-like esterase
MEVTLKLSSAKRILQSLAIIALAIAILLSSFHPTTGAHAATAVGTPGDPNIKYIGRWDTHSSTVAASYWPGAYLKTEFTGTTVKIKLGTTVSFFANIDNKTDTFYSKVIGTINLTPTRLAAGTHTLRIAAYSEHDDLQFQGLLLDPGAKTLMPTISPKLIEFVGDSITAGATTTKHALSDYAWLVGEQLKVEHTQIAQGGICLSDSTLCATTGIGMSSQFFKMQTVYFPNSPNWDFSRYQANVVVINLGTNDNGHHISDAAFQATYVAFIQKIRTKYPHAIILALRPFKGAKAAATLKTVQAVNAAGDKNVHYIDTTGWITAADTNDGLHPSDAGHVKITKHLAPIIASYLG